MTPAEMVAEFHARFTGIEFGEGDEAARKLYVDLIEEESREFLDVVEFDEGDVETAHELADTVYVCYGYAHARGWDLDALVGEIHRANLTKVGDDGQPVRDPRTGKVLKGPNYRPPDVAGVLEATS